MFNRKVKLPTTLDQYDQLVNKLVKKYKLKDPHHAAAILSVAIRHLPAHQLYVSLSYLGHYIQKNIANYVADHKSQTLRHESQIDQLVSLLTQDPNNNEARDGLEKAANDGSTYAKQALQKLDPEFLTQEAQALN